MVNLVKILKDIPCAVGIRNFHSGAGKNTISPDGAIVGSAIAGYQRSQGKDCAEGICERDEGCNKIIYLLWMIEVEEKSVLLRSCRTDFC